MLVMQAKTIAWIKTMASAIGAANPLAVVRCAGPYGKRSKNGRKLTLLLLQTSLCVAWFPFRDRSSSQTLS